jgi:hypothetical protein
MAMSPIASGAIERRRGGAASGVASSAGCRLRSRFLGGRRRWLVERDRPPRRRRQRHRRRVEVRRRIRRVGRGIDAAGERGTEHRVEARRARRGRGRDARRSELLGERAAQRFGIDRRRLADGDPIGDGDRAAVVDEHLLERDRRGAAELRQLHRAPQDLAQPDEDRVGTRALDASRIGDERGEAAPVDPSIRDERFVAGASDVDHRRDPRDRPQQQRGPAREQ